MRRPKILEDAGFDIYVNTQKLRDLPIPIEIMNIQDLIWCFDYPVWEKDQTDDWNLTPWEVIKNDKGTTEHRKRVNEVDIQYPIIVMFHKDKWVILDGIHRLVKAYELGGSKIEAQKLSKDSEFYMSALK
ncbi:MAG: hypothetical protein V4576_00860 [Patescibacteria group bacterium]